ncbi:MAG: FkbM family methyltransferase [Gammaproteobacteria bacterium]|nr:FkbM family methyltransferase [Gammaproteobacteria bacterium]MDH5800485.1 FkbM family methyltransferase [Gammaproteobacteria bacterium]
MFYYAPAQIADRDYFIYGQDTDINQHLKAVLEISNPKGRFLGFIPDLKQALSSDSKQLIVSCEPESLDAFEFQADPDTKSRCVFMPIPMGDTWSYWEAAKSFSKHLNRASYNEKPLSFSKLALPGLIEFFSDKMPGAFSVSGNNFIWAETGYLNHWKNLWQENTAVVQYISDRLTDFSSKYHYKTLLNGSAPEVWDLYFSRLFHRVQYMNYVNINPGDIVINAGVHTGSEIPFLLGKTGPDGSIVSIDPLGTEFLTPYVRQFCKQYPQTLTFVDAALTNYKGEIELPVGGNQDQVIGLPSAKTAGLPVKTFPCLTLNDLIETYALPQVDYMKFDLEGGEEHVIDDIVEVCTRYRCQVALSIYHNPTHYLTLPATMMQGLSDYNYYIEHYGFMRYETILYAIPKEKDVNYQRIQLELY